MIPVYWEARVIPFYLARWVQAGYYFLLYLAQGPVLFNPGPGAIGPGLGPKLGRDPAWTRAECRDAARTQACAGQALEPRPRPAPGQDPAGDVPGPKSIRPQRVIPSYLILLGVR